MSDKCKVCDCTMVQRTVGDGSDGPKAVPLSPTPEMIDAGAQRLVRWEDDCTWPDSWDALDVAAARNDAERVWREMWLAAGGDGDE